METNNIMNNEEVMEVAEEIVTGGTGNGLKIAAGAGVAVVAGVLAYKYIAKPLAAKIKSKKEHEVKVDSGTEEFEIVEVDSDSEK